ncbi:MAG: transglutaminase domain-containing protein [Candidatus Thorarchaeota archaeon]
MSDTPTETKRKIGIFTILSSLFIIFLIVWGAYTFILIQAGQVRTAEPHTPLNNIDDWPYDINWAGGRTNWFENINYTDLPLDQMLPEDLLAQLNNTIFIVEPANPAQLWRSSAYDSYDGSGWSKTLSGSLPLTPIPQTQATNEIYTISMNISIEPGLEAVEMPALFPNIRVIQDSFRTVPAGRIIDVAIETDQYDTLLLSPFLQGEIGETILFQYDVTYDSQDLTHVENHALPGSAAEASIASIYGDIDYPFSSTVTDQIALFESVGTNAYEKAMAVDVYFRTNYDLLIDDVNITERPQGQEVTEWFIERGGGLPMDFATAYCVFMRELGVPARMTIGYAMGDPDPDGRDLRLVQVKHMLFWVEVYIPQDDGPGEWIQVIPLPLPPGFGGGDLPENLDDADVQIRVGSPDFGGPVFSGIPQWVEIGNTFNLSAMLLVDQAPTGIGESIRFYDLTDGVDLGTAIVEPNSFLGLFPMANISFQFDPGATVGPHNISAMWISSTYLISNFTTVVAVGQSSPLEQPPTAPPDFQLSEIIDLDISLGLSDYSAHWNDTIHVHGIMTISGFPANGTYLGELGNDQMWIMWDGIWFGNATVGEDGYYELDILVNGLDLLRMDLSQHTISAFYAGVTDPDTGIPVVLPGSSSNSTVTLRGLPGFDLTVNPVDTYGGGSITYDGLAYLQNGTLLIGETIGIIFDGVEITTVVTNGTGGFNYIYNIPLLQPGGTYDAQVNWTSAFFLVDSDTSFAIPVTVQSGGTSLTIDSTPNDPQPVYIYEDITIFGTLTVTSDGTPLVGRTVEIWWDWNNGTVQLLGTNTTTAGGNYEFTYSIPAYSEGLGTYWAEWDAVAEPNYLDAISATMDITVKRYDVVVTVETIQSSVVVGEEIDIQGLVYLPEFPGFLGDAHLTLWWQNGTGIHNITGVTTSPVLPCWYTFNYSVPVGHELATIQLWAEYISESPALYSNVSSSLGIDVRNYDSYISILSNSSVVHLNESVLIYGYLEHENGLPLTGLSVNVEWNNGSSYFFPVVTNSSGWYEFIYNCTPATDSAGTVIVSVYHTAANSTYSDSSEILTPSLTLQLYQLTLDADVASNNVHLDEVILFSGTLTLDATGAPVSGATIIVNYRNSTGTYMFPKVTNGAGAFLFQYNCSLNDALGAVYVWAEYTSLNPLWDNAQSLNRTVNLILYSMTLTTFTNDTSYFIDQTVHAWGRLTYTHNSTPLGSQSISIWWSNGSIYNLGSVVTNSSGYFDYYYNLSAYTDSSGSVTIWAEFTTAVPLWEDADSTPGVTFGVTKYYVNIDMTVLPNPIYLNETVTIQVHLYYSHNGTDIVGEWVTLRWQNGSSNFLSVGLTNGVGLYTFVYSGMDEDTFLTPLIVAMYNESAYLGSNTTNVILTLERWPTLITGFDTGGLTTFQLAETVTITGTLFYDLVVDVPYGGVLVQILVDGTPVNTTTTASDGTFTGYWTIPGLTPTGDHDITVRYQSSVNWIAVYETAPITVTITAVNIIWTFDADPNVVYRSEWLHIYGTLALDNGSLYVGATVTIIWENTISGSGQRTIATVSTDGSGQFDYWYQLSDTEELGLTQLWAECASGIPVIAASSSPIEFLDVMQIAVVLTANGSHSTIYLDNTFTISGTLQFANTTPMVGYSVEINWDGNVIDTITITDAVSGTYSYDYYLSWDEIPRDVSYYVSFVRPTEAYMQADSTPDVLEIRDIITLSMDTQTVTSVLRGDTLLVTGTVTNGGGDDTNVPIALLVDSAPTGVYGTSDSNGFIRINFDIRNPTGIYNISIEVNSPNYDVTSTSGYWLIQVNITSEVSVFFEENPDIMPGEQFILSFSVSDQDGNLLVGESVNIYLNDTFVASFLFEDRNPNTQTITLSTALWNGGNGLFVAIVEFPGTQFVVGSTGQSTARIHVFINVEFRNLLPGDVPVGSSITLEGTLTDASGIAVRERAITLFLNDSTSVPLTTDEDGLFSYELLSAISYEASYTYHVQFVMADTTIVTTTHEFQIFSGLPPGVGTALLITWAVIVAIEAVVAMLIVARFRYKGRGIGIPRLGFSERVSEIHDSFVR